MKKVKILTITLIVILITMIAFGGIYVQKQNRMENKVKGYDLAMDLKGRRRIKLDVLTTDEEEAKTVQDYQKAKEVIEKRLKAIGAEDYLIRLNDETGEIVVEIPENSITDLIASYLGTIGKFEIKDKETEEVLMDNSDIELSNVVYGQNTNQTTGAVGTSVYLNIEFTKEGAKKLEEISKKYVKVEKSEEESSEENQTENSQEPIIDETNEEESSKQITILIDGSELMSTDFEQPVESGKLQLAVGSNSTDNQILQSYIEQASNIAIVLDNGNLPVDYDVVQNQYVESEIANNQLEVIIIAITVIAALALLALIVKYKKVGAMAVVAYIGLISIYLLLIRYANVVISIEGILGIAITMLLNYIFIRSLLKNELDINESYKKFFIKIIPIFILSLVCCFTKWATISSLGMAMFWGITLIAIYNFIVTNNIMKISK